MPSLLRELLHDAQRRGGEIAAGLATGQGASSAHVNAYRQRMGHLVEQARQLVSSMLADPDLDDPLYAASYFRDYKYVARLMQELENIPLLVLRRFSSQDEQLTALVGAICREIAFPFNPPICSSVSSQFYWTMPDMDVVFVPCLEPEHLLGLPEIYHELGHIVLFRERARLEYPALAIVDQHYDAVISQGTSLNWLPASLEEVERFRHAWRKSWLLEFAADLIATYLVGPAFGWCNIRTSTNLGGELFSGNESHPADDARAKGVGAMLNLIGCDGEAAEIQTRWGELIRLANEAAPQRYDLAYPDDLLTKLAEFYQRQCQSLGLRQFQSGSDEDAPVTTAVNDAWCEFRERPDTFGEYERHSMQMLAKRLGLTK